MTKEDDFIQKIIKKITDNHHKIIDDWGKAYVAQLFEEGVPNYSQWISVKEALPPIDKWVLVYTAYYEEKAIQVGKSCGTDFFEVGHCPNDYYGSCSLSATHWMALPIAPKE